MILAAVLKHALAQDVNLFVVPYEWHVYISSQVEVHAYKKGFRVSGAPKQVPSACIIIIRLPNGILIRGVQIRNTSGESHFI